MGKQQKWVRKLRVDDDIDHLYQRLENPLRETGAQNVFRLYRVRILDRANVPGQ